MTTQTIGVQWLAWSPEAFERALREDKLILVDSGAVWCHWCHVMDHRTYEDSDIIRLLNERFIPVRVDRDRQAEIDAQLQRSPAVISGQSTHGWPLTVVLTPEGHVVYKGTFVPPRADPHFGQQPGLYELLERIDQYWRSHREQLEQAAGELDQRVGQETAAMFSRPGELGQELVEEIVTGLKQAFDHRHGGFGDAPKFYNAACLELLLTAAWRGDKEAGEMVGKTLEEIAHGGVHDQLGGGFHRYSVDDRWHVPHFEKMAYDNAAMLGLYANAAAMLGRADFAAVARNTLGWIGDVLTDPDRRGFYASQDADTGPDDDGDYFTWTLAEVQHALGSDVRLAVEAYGIDVAGDIHGRPGRNVLHLARTPEQLSKLLADVAQPPSAVMSDYVHDLTGQIEHTRRRLLAARHQRPAPRVDTTVFADLNGMMIDAHLTAWERLGEASARERALAVLDNLLADLRDDRGVFAHYREDGRLMGIGHLADQAWMLRALVHAFAATARPGYVDAATKVADYILTDLTAPEGNFLSVLPAEPSPAAATPTTSWEDAPSRSAASVAAQALLELGVLTGQEKYGQAAGRALETFAAGATAEWATFLGGYALAVEALLNGPRAVVIVGPTADPLTSDLAAAARQTFLPAGLVIELDTDALKGLAEPAGLAESGGMVTLLHLLRDHVPTPAGTNMATQEQPRDHATRALRPAAFICRHRACLAPAHSREELAQRIEQLRKLP